jgi:hypothetical protein
MFSPVSWSRLTEAVSPTEDVLLPVVEMARGAKERMYLRSYDFAVEGSPTSSRLMSPLRCRPVSRFFSVPPRSMSRIACLMLLCP